MTKFFKSESGRSLIEMLVVIMVIMLISTGAMMGINQGWTLWQQRGIQDDTEGLTQEVFDLTAWQRHVNSETQLQKIGCENRLRGEKCAVEGEGGYWKNRFDGETKIAFKDDGRLEIIHTNVPFKICKWLLCDAEWVNIFPGTGCAQAEDYCLENRMAFYSEAEGEDLPWEEKDVVGGIFGDKESGGSSGGSAGGSGGSSSSSAGATDNSQEDYFSCKNKDKNKPWYYKATGECVECLYGTHCASKENRPFCLKNSCVQCRDNDDCAGDEICQNNACQKLSCDYAQDAIKHACVCSGTRFNACDATICPKTCSGGTPHCVASSCVECETNDHCADDEICQNNACKKLSCDYAQDAINHACVCSGTRFNACDATICPKTCSAGTPFCVASSCVECTTDDHCAGDEICQNNACKKLSCHSTQVIENHACVCPEGTVDDGVGHCCESGSVGWSEADQKCCAAGEEFSEGHCCAIGKVWDEVTGSCVADSCTDNGDCTGENEYCWLDSSTNGNSCTEKPTKGVCQPATVSHTKTINGLTYKKSNDSMNFWSAENFCARIGGERVSVSDFQCGYDFVGNKEIGHCNADDTDSWKGVDSLSDTMKEFLSGLGSSWVWTDDDYNACRAYYVALNEGYVSLNYRYGHIYALCRVGG